MTMQLDLLAPPVERIVVEPTPDVIHRGASAESVPTHTHAPSPRPKGIGTDDDWLLVLSVAEEQIRWRSWTQPHPIPLEDRPDSTGGRSAGGRWIDYGTKGVAVCELGAKRRYVAWPTLLKGLREQREHEPHIADARDLAATYKVLTQYDYFYVRDGGSVYDGLDRGEWRETVAIPHLAKLKAIVEELGGDPSAVSGREAVAA